MQKKLLILAVVVLVLIGGAVFVWEKKTSQEMPQSELKEVVKIVENTDTNYVDISDWRTYHNEEYGFEIKYPSEWGIPESFRLIGGIPTMSIHPTGYSEGCCVGVRIEAQKAEMSEVYKRLLGDYPKEDVLLDETKIFNGQEVKELLFLTHYGDKNERVTAMPLTDKSTMIVFRRGDKDSWAEAIIYSFKLTSR